jgi:hypothetical protein
MAVTLGKCLQLKLTHYLADKKTKMVRSQFLRYLWWNQIPLFGRIRIKT